VCVVCAVASLAPARAEPPAGGGGVPACEPFPSEPPSIEWVEVPPIGVRLTWTGVAGLVLETEGTRVAFDPFVSRPGVFATVFRRPVVDRSAVARTFSGLDAVFVGHAHHDHAMDVAEVAAVSPRARVHAGPTAIELFARQGVARERLVVAEDRASAQAGAFRVEAIRSRHGVVPFLSRIDRARAPRRGMPRTPFRWPRGEVLAWRVEVRGRAIHVQGSAGIDDAALARCARADVLVACLAARAGTPRYLERLGERLAPRVLVPIHHDDFFVPLEEPPRPIRTLDWASFLEEAAALERAYGTRLVRPVRGVPIAL
jgi:L-ascorbate metabolism protein UlaG (beta-lactamase superfamily)